MVKLNRCILQLKMKNCKKKKNIWNKVSNSMKKEFDSEPICTKEFLKTKTKSYDERLQMPKVKEFLK